MDPAGTFNNQAHIAFDGRRWTELLENLEWKQAEWDDSDWKDEETSNKKLVQNRSFPWSPPPFIHSS